MASNLKAPSRLLAEFLVIVLGVSVGLFADDWRQKREIEAEERRFLEDVHADLLADSAEIVSVRDWFGGWDTGVVELRPWLERSSIPQDTLLRLAGQLAGFTTYEPTRAAYERMKASGRMNFLGDRDLQSAVGSYFETQQTYLQSVIANIGTAFGIRWVMDSVEWFGPEDPVAAGTHWVVDPETGVPGWSVRVPWDELRADPEFLTALERVGFFGGNISARFDGALRENAELRGLIRDALDMPGSADDS